MIGSVWYFVFLGIILKKPKNSFDEDTFVEELARAVFGDVDPARGGVGKRKGRR
jgi:hypothetical protein